MKTSDIQSEAFEGTDYEALPSEFVATVVSEKNRDKTGKECVILGLELEDGKSVSQKYTPLHYTELAEALNKLGVNDTHDLLNKKFRFVSQKFSSGFPRWLPREQR